MVEQSLSLSLALPGSEPEPEQADLGPEADSQQYRRVLSVVESQSRRLIRHGALRLDPGYDLSDPFIDDDHGKLLVPGFPCLLAGTSEVAAFLGPGVEVPGTYRLRQLGCQGQVVCWHQNQVLPLPTRAATQGDWVLPVDLPEGRERLYGRRGFCTVGCRGSDATGFWVSFEPAEEEHPFEAVLLPPGCIVALPALPGGTDLTPWEMKLSRAGRKTEALPNEAELENRLQLKYSGHFASEIESSDTEGSLTCTEASDDVASSAQADESSDTCVRSALCSQVEALSETQDQEQQCNLEFMQKLLCQVCGHTEPCDELVACEHVAQCRGAAHAGCLALPSAVNLGSPWRCARCCALSDSRRSSGVHPAHKRPRQHTPA